MQNSLISQFERYSSVLHQYRDYWQLVPFEHRQVPWQNSLLQERLEALSMEDITAIDQTPALQSKHFDDIFPELFELIPIACLPAKQDYKSVPFWLSNAIGGRKLEQINAFIRHLPDCDLPVLEWCAGKGHLGRLLSFQQQRSVTSVEWQEKLCQQGRRLAEINSLEQSFVHADVMSVQGAEVLKPKQQIVALHACGQLHLQLLQQAVQNQNQQLHLVPCCYHLIDSPFYQPLSREAKHQDLALSRHDLRLAVQGQVTGGARVTKLRHTEVWWRLSYQALYADMTSGTGYRPLTSVAKHWFTGNFADFSHWAAAQHDLTIPDNPDWAFYLQQGARHQEVTQRIELVRHLFRRALEVWLLLDRALFLQEHGYQVSIGSFCDYQTTPRNLLIQAQRC